MQNDPLSLDARWEITFCPRLQITNFPPNREPNNFLRNDSGKNSHPRKLKKVTFLITESTLGSCPEYKNCYCLRGKPSLDYQDLHLHANLHACLYYTSYTIQVCSIVGRKFSGKNIQKTYQDFFCFDAEFLRSFLDRQ